MISAENSRQLIKLLQQILPDIREQQKEMEWRRLGLRPPRITTLDSKIVGRIRALAPARSGADPEAVKIDIAARFENADRLMARAAKTSPEEAVAWLPRALSETHADIRLYAEILGAQIDFSTAFSNGIEVSDWPQVPGNSFTELMRQHSHLRFVASVEPSVVAWTTYGAVSTDGLPAPQALSGFIDRVRQIVLPLTITDVAACPTIGRTWGEFVDPDIHDLGAARTWPHQTEDGAAPVWPVAIRSEAQKIVEKYLALPKKTLGPLHLALDRLNLARRRASPGNKAIELAIALEALVGTRENDSLTHKVSTRAAVIMGGDLAGRMMRRRLIKGLYTARSSVVHGGSIDKKLSATIGEGFRIVSRLCQLMLERGEPFDLDAVDLLGSLPLVGTPRH
jgi:hypothetical protein